MKNHISILFKVIITLFSFFLLAGCKVAPVIDVVNLPSDNNNNEQPVFQSKDVGTGTLFVKRIGHLISGGTAEFIVTGEIPLGIESDYGGTYNVHGALSGEIVDVYLMLNEQVPASAVGKIIASIDVMGIFKPDSCSIVIENIREEWLRGGHFTITVAGMSFPGTWEDLDGALDLKTFNWKDLKFSSSIGHAENYPMMFDANNINWVETWRITQLTVDPSLNCIFFDYSE